MASIIKEFRYAFAVISLFLAGASAFSSIQLQTTKALSTTLSSSFSLSMASVAAPMLPEGLVKTVVNVGERNSRPIGRGDIVTVKYTCYSSIGDGGDFDNVLLARSNSQKMVVGDGSMVPGWDAALRSMVMGERAVVRLTDPALGYGTSSTSKASAALEALGTDPTRGELEFDIAVLKVQTAAQAAEMFDMNFDAMALQDNMPKTAQEIADAYQVRMDNRTPDKEGLEGWIETIKNYYFFGFFEGETGEEAPWYLKPSITFPIAFAVVGAAFAVSLGVGAISEKGAQSIDELDTIVKATTMLMMDVPGIVVPGL